MDKKYEKHDFINLLGLFWEVGCERLKKLLDSFHGCYRLLACLMFCLVENFSFKFSLAFASFPSDYFLPKISCYLTFSSFFQMFPKFSLIAETNNSNKKNVNEISSLFCLRTKQRKISPSFFVTAELLCNLKMVECPRNCSIFGNREINPQNGFLRIFQVI